MESGFIKADSRNLPEVTASAMFEYRDKKILAETRGVKAAR
jgi:hypothetical protein